MIDLKIIRTKEHSDFMPIVGLNLKNVSANVEEKKVVEGNINVNSAPTIEGVEKKTVGLPGLKDVVSINFKFETIYEPKIGEIVIKGEVLYYTEKEKEMVDKWKKEKKLDENVAAEVLNAIFRRCLTKAIDLSNELRLPPPIRFPIVKPKEQSEYIG